MLEVLRAGGMDVIQAMRILIPPAWQTVDNIDPDVRAFYEFYDCQLEPWDGPAGIVLTDGRYAACCLDRNGLRPARYVITKDRHLTVASEVGVYDYKEQDVVEKGRLGPGQMLAVDLVEAEPYREHRWAQLMRALAVQGRAVDALAVYERVRILLRDDLGVAPGEELSRLERFIRAHEDEIEERWHEYFP